MKTVRFHISYTVDATINAADLWPNGDVPENPTAADVENLIMKSGGFPKIIRDWNLEKGGFHDVHLVEPGDDP